MSIKKKLYLCKVFKKRTIMVIEIEKGSATDFKHSLRRIKESRKIKKGNFSKFFGVLPNIGDGLAFQMAVRNEWN